MVDSSLIQENLCSEISEEEAREIISKQITSLEQRLFTLGVLSLNLMSTGLFYLEDSFQPAKEKLSKDLATLYIGGISMGIFDQEYILRAGILYPGMQVQRTLEIPLPSFYTINHAEQSITHAQQGLTFQLDPQEVEAFNFVLSIIHQDVIPNIK